MEGRTYRARGCEAATERLAKLLCHRWLRVCGAYRLDVCGSYLPYLRGSYSCWGVGQYTRFAGYERVHQGPIHFAGEHCSLEMQGYMEGAARAPSRAAREVLQDVALDGKPVDIKSGGKSDNRICK